MPVRVQGPDGRQYDFPDGTDKASAIAYFKKNGIGVERPGVLKRMGEATGVPTSVAEYKAASRPSTAEAIGGPAVTAAKLLKDYAQNVYWEGRRDLAMPPVAPTGNFVKDIGNAPQAQFLMRGVLGPFGGTGVANLGEDIANKNYRGATGDVLGTIINALLLGKARGPSERIATNRLTNAAGRQMYVPVRESVPILRETAKETGVRPSSLQDFHSVAQSASENINREANAALSPIAMRQILPSSIAKKIRDLVTPDMSTSPEGRAEIQYINSQARLFEKPWTFEQLDSKRMRLNSDLNTFERKGELARYTAKKGNLNVAIDKTVADTIRDIVYPQMDAAAGKPVGYFRALKQKQGNLMELSSELNPTNRKGRTVEREAAAADIQGGPRFSRENVSAHAGIQNPIPRVGVYGLSRFLKKPNPLEESNKRVRMGFQGTRMEQVAKPVIGSLPMRSTLFPAEEDKDKQR